MKSCRTPRTYCSRPRETLVLGLYYLEDPEAGPVPVHGGWMVEQELELGLELLELLEPVRLELVRLELAGHPELAASCELELEPELGLRFGL